MEEQDMTNFSNSSSSHRLPTISASEALRNASAWSRSISTGLPSLDSALQPDKSTVASKGLPCGSVTEIYGPPGVGKTAFAIQAAVNALHSPSAYKEVVWIDTGAPLPGPRFKQIFTAYGRPSTQDRPSSPPVTQSEDRLLDSITYFHAPTLAHLLTLFLHPTSKFPPPRTLLIIVDNVSALFATAFSRSVDRRAAGSSTFAESARNAAQQKAANRKWAVAGDLASAMAKMAQLHNCAVLAVNQVATSLRGVRKAVLRPSLAGNGWDAGVHHRILLYRDFAPIDASAELSEEEMRGMRFAEVKVSGKAMTDTMADVVPFVIEQAGLREIRLARLATSMPTGPPDPLEEDKSLKRKADEIADSEDEDNELASEDELGVPDEFLEDSYAPDR